MKILQLGRLPPARVGPAGRQGPISATKDRFFLNFDVRCWTFASAYERGLLRRPQVPTGALAFMPRLCDATVLLYPSPNRCTTGKMTSHTGRDAADQ